MEMTFLRMALVSVVLLLAGCDNASTPVAPKAAATVLEGKTMGTFWRVSVVGIDNARADQLRQKVQQQLDADDQRQLWQETTLLAEILKDTFAADKMNVATLGNVVSQLHVHVIVRRRDDVAWPAPVWGRHPAQPYAGQQLGQIIDKLRLVLTEDFQFAGESA